ncbi:MAG: monovalent cation/H(+) antiporter subunit G [Rhodovarius sp.]|nr:monovalent cation/H(+) antiporter subunit G [Rhodovarius sp.]
MAEPIAALLLVAGAGIALIAAIGVARLPDAFLRMHAATKAGLAGAGLVLIGTGIAFASSGAWLRVGLILLFLLVTLPIASHALGRAAYIGGAPMWRGTRDDLRGVLPRGDIDTSPAEVASAAQALPPRLLVVLAEEQEAEAALASALRVLGPRASEVTLLAPIPPASRELSGVRAGGKAEAAARSGAQRLLAARADLKARAAGLERCCEELGLPCAIRIEEGRAEELIAAMAAGHELLVLPRASRQGPGAAGSGRHGSAAIEGAGLPALLLEPPAWPAPSGLWFLHADDALSDAALERLLGLRLFAGLPVTVAVVEGPGAVFARRRALMMAEAAGRQAAAGPLLPAARPIPELPPQSLPAIPAAPRTETAAWRSLRHGRGPLLLL